MKESLFKFSDPKLISFDINVNKDFDKELYEGFSFDNKVENFVIEENKEAVVTLYLKIGEKNNKFPFFIELEITAVFKNESEKDFDTLLNTNAPALLLSYSRPVISLMTTQCGFPAFNIPFINFTDND